MLIGGKGRPIEGNINGLIELTKEHGINLIKGFEKDSFSFEYIRAIVYVALKHGAKKAKVEQDFTIEDIGDWLKPSNMNQFFDICLNCFFEGVEKKDGEAGESVGGS